MISIKTPRLSLLNKTNLNPDYYHSILISLCRGLAALEVAAAHVRAHTLPSLKSLPDPNIWYQGLSFLTGFAHQAVVIFFLLSGWLVGGSFLNKLKNSDVVFTYAIDRITRLWIVMIPVFVTTLGLAMLSGIVDPMGFDYSAGNEYSAAVFFGNLIGLQEFVLPNYGGNFALWSLAYETWYYVLFPLLIMALIAKKTATRIGSAIVVVIIALNLNTGILLYFSVWILGAAGSRIKINLNAPSQKLLIVTFFVIAIIFRLRGSNNILTSESFFQDVLYGLVFLMILSSRQWLADINSRKVRWFKIAGSFLSQFSFTLYVIHVPLLKFFKHICKSLFGIERLSPDEPLHFAIYFAILTTIVLFSYVFFLFFEAHTYELRQCIKKAIQRWYSGMSTVDSPAVPKR